MELLCILQPPKELLPPRIVRSNHLFSYGRAGELRAETSSAMSSTGKGKGNGKVFGK